jgi:hypothetical protein
MVCGLFPLFANFGLGEIADGETPVLKLTLPLLEFPVARLMGGTNDSFRVTVEVAAANVIGRYARGEHDTCIAVVPNNGRLNRVFEQDGVPYQPHLVPSSEASKEAVKKRESDDGARPAVKRAKVPG